MRPFDVSDPGVSKALSGRLLITLDSPSGRHDVAVPQDALIDDLVPSLVEVCEGGQGADGWRLVPIGETALPGTRTLRECGIYAGAVLTLVGPGRLENAEGDAEQRAKERAIDIDRAGDAAYMRLLGDAIAAPRLGASTVIAVISEHHAAGATTVAVLLGMLLADLRDDQVAVVDANPESGALSHWMVPDSAPSREAYVALFRPNLAPEQVRAALVSASPKLSILAAPAEPAGAAAGAPAGWSRVIEHLRRLHNIVILDCGAGTHRPLSKAALDAADQVVLVSKPQPVQVDSTMPDVESLRSLGRSVVVVTNQAPNRARSARSADGVQHVTITYEPHHAKRLRTRGFSWARAPVSWQVSLRELAAVLAGSLGAS